MRKKSLPPDVVSAVKRLAHELSRIDYLQYRETLLRQTRARIEAGEAAPAVIADLEVQTRRGIFGSF